MTVSNVLDFFVVGDCLPLRQPGRIALELRAFPLSSAVLRIPEVLVSFLLQITLTVLMRTFEVQPHDTLQGSDSDAISEKDFFIWLSQCKGANFHMCLSKSFSLLYCFYSNSPVVCYFLLTSPSCFF